MTPEEYKRQQIIRRRREAKRRRERRKRILILILAAAVIVAAVLLVTRHFAAGSGASDHKRNSQVENSLSAEQESSNDGENSDSETTEESPNEDAQTGDASQTEDSQGEGASEDDLSANENIAELYSFEMTEDTVQMSSDQVISTYGLLVDCDNGAIIASRDGTERINPASMTKILTVLVAAESLEDESSLEDTVTITLEITDYVYSNDCSAVGFSVDETVPVKDLFYGTILPSGADAAVALATYIAGSQDAFVELMNEKLEELGLSCTAHFTNCVGLYDEDHYCTLLDMAVILNAAMDNELCRDVLSAHTYTTTATDEHPEGILISNWFLRRIEDKDCGGTVVGAKTGFVNQSGNCAASYFTAEDGRNYICVTAGGTSSWRAIYDHVAIYNIYAVGNTGYVRG